MTRVVWLPVNSIYQIHAAKAFMMPKLGSCKAEHICIADMVLSSTIKMIHDLENPIKFTMKFD